MVRIQGRIDRIDIREQDNKVVARVIDYKTGQSPGVPDMEKGLVIQLPLYVKAVDDVIMPDITIEGGMYYNLKYASYDPVKKKLLKCTSIGPNWEPIASIAEKRAVNAAVSVRNALFAAPETCNDRCEWRSPLPGRQNRKRGASKCR